MGELPEEIYFFEAEQVIETHNLQLEENGGGVPGLSAEGLGALNSAIAQPKGGMYGLYFHPSLFLMAAAYLYHIGRGHAFTDGNKRTALAVALEFLDFHGIFVQATEEDLLRLVFHTVSSGEYTEEHLPPDILPYEVNTVLPAQEMKQVIAAFFEAHAIAIST